MDIQIGQRVRISDDAFPGSDDQDDIEARGKEVTVFASVSDDGCWLVETDEYDLLPVLDTELEPIEAQP
jgi:hypothetical protein